MLEALALLLGPSALATSVLRYVRALFPIQSQLLLLFIQAFHSSIINLEIVE